MVHDVFNDTSAGGITDILKRNDEGAKRLFEPLQNEQVLTFAGIKFKQTTTAPTTTIAGNTYYQTYIVADDAQFSVFLGKNPPDLGFNRISA